MRQTYTLTIELDGRRATGTVTFDPTDIYDGTLAPMVRALAIHVTPTWVVICEDGVRRHKEPFLSKFDANQWAHWGHGCTNTHDIREEELTL